MFLSPGNRPERKIHRGRFVTLQALNPEVHGPTLYAETHGPENERVWRYLFDGPFLNYESFLESLEKKARSEDPLFHAIVDNASGRVVGYAALMRIEPAHRCIEVGSILYTPRFQRTAGATEAMYLLARYVFEELGYRRYEWKCNAENEPSRKAAMRLGFKFEGIFHQHMIVKGQNRDTAWYAMLDRDWPARQANFERWLGPSNFNAEGRQKSTLSLADESAAMRWWWNY